MLNAIPLIVLMLQATFVPGYALFRVSAAAALTYLEIVSYE